ncbi:DUF6119 family protein [Pseudonocardia lacus]|uniref:DUF6119 family protein n=1 Tax=Pseudonocardia lacus TaxID=2835865 RepID=UPI001BDD2F84|nr:DUF6119 family protein [Pseudonocardia lacus]
MTIDLPADVELGDPGRTGQVCLYKMVDDRPFDECWEPPEDDVFDSLDVPDLGEALLVYGQREPTVCGWVEMVHGLTDVHLDHFTTTRASALLFVRVGGHGFALSFGDGYRRLVRSAVDRGFGLALALRVIDADAVRHIKREHLTGTGRVDTSSVPDGDALWSFGIREHSELVRRIVGKANDDSRLTLSHVRKMAKRGIPPVSIDFADRVRLPLPHSPRHLLADLAEIVRVLDEGKVDDDLAPLQWVRRLGAGDQERINAAWDQALELLVGYDERVSLAYPAGYHGGQEISRFDVQIGRNRVVTTDEMDLRFLREALEDQVTREARLSVLGSGRITGFDDAGEKIADGVAPLHWLTASVDLPDGSRAVLLDGDWFDVSDAYRDHVDRIVGEAFERRPDWALPAWRSVPADPKTRKTDEKRYNEHVGTRPGFLNLDRKLVYCRTHPGGFEACDLLGPNNELVHVKRVSSKTGSGPVSHLIAQGIVAIESLTDPQTWQKFVETVRAQDPARAATLGARPAALVYAIHRSNGLLTPDKLFTFARSEMASAATMLAKLGIPLRICVIP